ncbi:MAG: peptide deformylase [Phycisphaerales bacterium]|jgi:peptide deformylase
MTVDPSQLRLAHFPSEVLRRRASPIQRIDESVRGIASRMREIMREEAGIGLAAPQVGVSLRMFVVDIDLAETEHAVYINPRLSGFEGDLVAREEGCLSLPGIRAEIRRPPKVTITALDLDGREFTDTAEGLVARVWQHEFDHLDGVLILDRMTPIDRIATRKAVKELLAAKE